MNRAQVMRDLGSCVGRGLCGLFVSSRIELNRRFTKSFRKHRRAPPATALQCVVLGAKTLQRRAHGKTGRTTFVVNTHPDAITSGLQSSLRGICKLHWLNAVAERVVGTSLQNRDCEIAVEEQIRPVVSAHRHCEPRLFDGLKTEAPFVFRCSDSVVIAKDWPRSGNSVPARRH